MTSGHMRMLRSNAEREQCLCIEYRDVLLCYIYIYILCAARQIDAKGKYDVVFLSLSRESSALNCNRKKSEFSLGIIFNAFSFLGILIQQENLMMIFDG